MSDPTVSCPSCGHEFKLTESLAAPLLESERKRFAVEEARKARQALEAELATRDRLNADLQGNVKVLNEKLTAAQGAEVEFRRKERELNDRLREAALAVEKGVAAGLAAVEAKALQRADEASRQKLAEKDKVVADALRQVDEMKRRMEQGSQQLQGEVQELELEALLRSRFPHDVIEPVPKGEHGGDALQRIVNTLGQACGCILWEAKRTKSWSDGWLPKLRDDQRLAKADLAILVSTALPKGVESFECVDAVWVTSPRVALAVATVMRRSLMDLAAARKGAEGQQSKMQLVYQYLTGPDFRRRVEAMLERYNELKDGLEREKKFLQARWAERHQQIDKVLEATAGLYGDLQGIAGRSLQEIAGLEAPALPEAGEPREP